MRRRTQLHVDAQARAQVARGLARLREAFAVPDGFPAPVLAEAQQVAAALAAGDGGAGGIRGAGGDRGAGGAAAAVADRRDLALRTLDPAGSRDLDQAFALTRAGAGYVLHYAIADVATVVAPAGAIAVEARDRGVTLYLPDARAPLHPTVLSEGVASLLPGQDTHAVLWRIALDSGGATTGVAVERALVRSRAQLSYGGAQRALDDGAADGQLCLLAEVGTLLAEREAARGGVSLELADQEVVSGGGGYELRFARPLAVERHNSHLSLLTGIEAARLMLAGGVGVLRTLPRAGERAVAGLRRVSAELDQPWHDTQTYAEWVRSVDPATPRGVALLTQALRSYRGAGYVVVRGTPPEHHEHAALAAPYAHVTAPLRRLVDRFANQVVLDLTAGREVSGWVAAALDDLPGLMARATQRAATIDRAVEDLVEAVLLQGRVGSVFPAITVDHRGDASVIHLLEPAVVAEVDGDLPLGSRVDVRLMTADPTAGTVRFTVA